MKSAVMLRLSPPGPGEAPRAGLHHSAAPAASGADAGASEGAGPGPGTGPAWPTAVDARADMRQAAADRQRRSRAGRGLPGLDRSPGMRLRQREREAACTVLALVLLLALFTTWPTLDLQVSALFHRPDHGFIGNDWALVRGVYLAVPWLGWAAAMAGALVAATHWSGPRGLGVRWWRRTMVLALMMLLGVAGLVNGVLKEHWGRARPVAVQAFGGERQFSAAGVPVDQCSRNCSFVSGHAATGFAVGAIGLLGSPRTRRRWARAGLIAGLLVGLGRISQGGHFLSDVLFAGLAMQACGGALRLAWLRVRVSGRRPWAGRVTLRRRSA
ncbi:MAG: hypothetical protein RL223_2972 [Pseudomonadota bacterium]